MADWPTDVAALADALGIDRFVVAGHSAGGPYAVACAALLLERVSGVVLDGVTDLAWPGAWEGYFDMESHLMYMADEEAAIARCAEQFGADGSGFLTSDFEMPEPDNALFADAYDLRADSYQINSLHETMPAEWLAALSARLSMLADCAGSTCRD